jgi:hypothetical protein
MTSLPTLPLGEGCIWSPAVSVLQRQTFPPNPHLCQLEDPGDGEAVMAPELSAVDIAALRESMFVSWPSNVVEKISMPSAKPANMKLKSYLRLPPHRRRPSVSCCAAGGPRGQRRGRVDRAREAGPGTVARAGTIAHPRG